MTPKTLPEPSFTSNKGKLLFGRQALPLVTRLRSRLPVLGSHSCLTGTHHEISEADTP